VVVQEEHLRSSLEDPIRDLPIPGGARVTLITGSGCVIDRYPLARR
jgi:hypothetical protein